MATALRKVSNFLIMVLKINFLLIVLNYLEGLLEKETERCASAMRRKGYFGFTKNYFKCRKE